MNAGGVKNRGLNDRNQVITTSLANKLTQVEKGNTSAGAEATYPSSSGDGSKQNADSDHSQRDARGDDLAAREETLAKRERALYTRQEALNNAPSNTGPECAGTALVKNAIRGNTEAKTAATVDSVPPTAAATTDNETTVPTAPSLPPSSDIDNVPPPPPLKVVATVTGAPLAGRGSLLAGVGQVTLRRPKEDRQDTVLPDGKKNASPATFIGSIAGGYAAMELRKRNVNQGLGTAAPTSDTGLPPGPAKGARAGVAAKGDMPDWPKSAIAAGKAVAAAKKVVTATTTSTVEGSNPTQRAKPTAADVRDEGSNNKGTGNDTVTTVNRQAELKAQIAKTKKALAEKKAAEAIFEVKTKNDSAWFLFSSLSDDKSFSEIYEKKFGIEKCFQDQKSSGFDIEKTKIRKYNRFKRLYFSMCLAQLFAVLVGEYVQNNNHPLKKKFIFLRTCYQHFQARMVEFKLFFKQAIGLIVKKSIDYSKGVEQAPEPPEFFVSLYQKLSESTC
ncbi:hypothetical protein FACS1894126_1740 [Alphaproteobacteria bacterium]|nr:hypothetical protein FACS1894126_1740 [Alphaproteobacteria bacterium]